MEDIFKENIMYENVYEKPLLEEQSGLIFPQQILEAFNGGRFCVQCSGCHGCR